MHGQRIGYIRVITLDQQTELQLARQMYENKSLAVVDICKALGIPRSTFYKYVPKHARK